MSKVWHCAKKTATYFLLIQVTAHWKFGAPLTLVRWIMQKVEKVEGGGWESIVYIVILIATYFQEEAGQIWGCEGRRNSAVWDGKGSDVAQLGAKTPTKMIVINQATDQQISSTVISSPPNPLLRVGEGGWRPESYWWTVLLARRILYLTKPTLSAQSREVTSRWSLILQ